MKRKTLLTAVSIVAVGSHAAAPTGAIPVRADNPAELVAFKAAIEGGSPSELQQFLAAYPASKFVGEVFAKLVQQVQPPQALAGRGNPDILFVQYGSESDSWVDQNRNDLQAPPPRRQQTTQQPGQGNVSQAQRTLDAVEKASGRLNSDISRCSINDPIETVNDCLGLALSYYATSLSSPKVVLPPQLKPIPKIVVRTARAVRTAKTAKRAREAVAQAVREIRKQVELLQVADDSAAAKLQVRAGNVVAASLNKVGDKLRQAEL